MEKVIDKLENAIKVIDKQDMSDMSWNSVDGWVKSALREAKDVLVNRVIVDKLPPVAMSFHKWIIENGWQEHSSKEYWYRSKHSNQWPPKETATESELMGKFYGR